METVNTTDNRKFMKKYLTAIVALAVAVFPVAGEGQGSTPAAKADSIERLELTLEEAQDYAVENNRSLQNASLQVRQAYAARWQTIATMLPQVNASLDYSDMCGYVMDLGAFPIAMPASGTIGITASIALSGSQIMGALLNNLSIEMNSITEKKSESDLRNTTSYIYMSILAMEETVGLLDNNLKNLQKLYEMTQHSVLVGVAEQTDADQISVQVSGMEKSAAFRFHYPRNTAVVASRRGDADILILPPSAFRKPYRSIFFPCPTMFQYIFRQNEYNIRFHGFPTEYRTVEMVLMEMGGKHV